MDAVTQRLEEGVREIFESGKFEEYLRVMSKFHHYSVRNSVLIALQNPDATLCSGYQAWKKNFGRYVKKGEKAIEIIAPIKYEVKVKDLKDEVMIRKYADRNPEDVIRFTTFRPAYVFDVSQTDGKPLPEIAPDIAGSVEHFHEFMQAVKATSPVPIVTEPLTIGRIPVSTMPTLTPFPVMPALRRFVTCRPWRQPFMKWRTPRSMIWT